MQRARRQALRKLIAGILATVLYVAGAYAEGLSAPFPSQPLADALDAFAKATGYQLVYRSELTVRMTSIGADPGLSAEQTLHQLLRGTGLDFQFINERTVAIYRSMDTSRDSNCPPQATPDQPPPSGGFY